jgi:predicted secreted Zn-dependent protease
MEMIRVWIGNKDIHVSMLLGMWEEMSKGEVDEREAWGELLADLIRHIANGLTQSHDYNQDASEQRIANAIINHLGYGANTIVGEVDP